MTTSAPEAQALSLPEVRAGQHPSCNLCGFEETTPLLEAEKRVHSPRHRVIYRYCRRCSFVSLDLNYDEWLASYVEGPAARDPEALSEYARQQREETDSVIAEIGKVYPEISQGRGRRLADIGAGAGGALSCYQALGWETVGVELGQPQARFARQNGKRDVRSEAYGRSSFPSDSLDFIHCYHTLEHLPQPYRALTDFYAHLKPGGRLYVEVPNLMDISIYQMGFGHVSLFSSRTLPQALSACGFRVVSLFNRSRFSTFGIGALCQRPDSSAPTAGGEDYLPPERLLGWQKDSEGVVRWKLWYAFHAGRGREALTPTALLGLLRWAARKALHAIGR